MGRKSGKGKGGQSQATSGDSGMADLLKDLGDMFKPMPPNKRNELNSHVEKLLGLTSNYTQDEGCVITPAKLFQEFQEIWSLVSKIRALEDQFNMTRRLRESGRQVHLEAFLHWLIDTQGGKIKNLEVKDYGSDKGFGLKMTEDTKRGEVVISVPRKCFMSTETAKDSSLSTLMDKDPMLKTMPNVALALHLVLEKNSPASYWEAYINVLPSKYSTVLYFTPQDFEELKGSPALEDALKQFKYVARQYAYFYRKFQSTMLKDYFTFDDYRWAVSTVMTRQNQVPVKDLSKTTNTLVPFWDFSNHHCSTGEEEISTDFSDETGETFCMANRDFSAGDEFTIFYGVRTNADFLVHNGFVPSGGDNPHDAYILKLGVSKNDPGAADKLEMLDILSIPRHSPYFSLSQVGAGDEKAKPFDNLLLAFVRILCLKTKEELQPFKDDPQKVRDLLNDTFDQELDQKAYKYIETRCTLLLRSYSTSLEEDTKMLGSDEELKSFTRNKINCIRLRIGEKKILGHVIKFCQSKTAAVISQVPSTLTTDN